MDKMKVTIEGNVGSNPEHFNNGQACKVSLYVKDSENSKSRYTVKFFNHGNAKLAEWAASSLRKGTRVIIEGNGKIEQFTPTGSDQQVSTFVIFARDFAVLRTKDEIAAAVYKSDSAPQPNHTAINGMNGASNHYGGHPTMQAPHPHPQSHNYGGHSAPPTPPNRQY